MATLLEYVGSVHIFLGPYRGNPIALYLCRNGDRCIISPKAYPWNEVVGQGETPNKAAADFEEKWKAKGLSPEMYSGPSWEGGIKPERPAPPKPAAPPRPAGVEAAPVAAKATDPTAQPAAPAPVGETKTASPPSETKPTQPAGESGDAENPAPASASLESSSPPEQPGN